jgi:PAS domain-containing protein
MIFSVPHINLQTGVFINSAERAPASIDELGSRLIGTTRDSLSDAFARQRGFSRLKYFGTLSDSLVALDRGEVDVVMASQVITAYYVRQNGYRRIQMTEFAVPGLSYELHMAVSPREPALLYSLNRGLARIRANGTYDRIYERWIGQLEPRRLRLRDVQPYLAVLGAILVAVAAALAGQRHLLARLAKQTDRLRASEQRLSLVLEGSEDAFWDWDLHTGRSERSERWAAMLGYTLAEIEPT